MTEQMLQLADGSTARHSSVAPFARRSRTPKSLMTSRVRSLSVREIDSASCEMKRMFVYTQFHGKGVGHALADAVINEARALGYRTMRLDTSIRQDEARGLYQRLGFKTIEPYYELPAELRNWLVFMELSL